MPRLYSAFVVFVVFGIAMRVSDAVLAYADKEVTVAETATGTLATVTATTAAGNGNTVAFSVNAGTGSLAYVAVAAASGAVSNCVVTLASGKSLDYEEAKLATGKKYEATVSAQEKNSENTDIGSAVTFKVTLVITDVAEFTTSTLSITIKENLAGGAAVGTVTTTGTGFALAISSQTKTPGWFAIDASTGAITVVSGQTVNYEDADLTSYKYSVVIVATKAGVGSGTGTATITITDTDDFSNEMTLDLLTGTAAGTKILTLTTTPASSAVALSSQTGSLGWFELDTANKQIKVASGKSVDRAESKLETDYMYNIVLTVGTGAKQGTGTVVITVTQSGVSAVVANVMLSLGLILLFKLL